MNTFTLQEMYLISFDEIFISHTCVSDENGVENSQIYLLKIFIQVHTLFYINHIEHCSLEFWRTADR